MSEMAVKKKTGLMKHKMKNIPKHRANPAKLSKARQIVKKRVVSVKKRNVPVKKQKDLVKTGGEVVETPVQEEEIRSETQEEQTAPAETEAPAEEVKGEQTIGDIVEAEGLVTEPDRESMLGQEKEPTISEIVVRLDKMEGKMDMFQGVQDAFNQRIMDLNEKLGDTRRMVFEREKASTKLEGEFDKVATIVKETDPEKITLKFEKFNAELERNKSEIQRMDDFFKNMTEKVNIIQGFMDKIKSVDNIMTAAGEVDKRVKQIEDGRNYTDKLAGKTESMFLEMNDKLSFVKKNFDKVEKVDAMMKDVLKDVDRLKFRADEELVKKKELEKMLEVLKEVVVEDIVGINPVAFSNLRRRVTLIENLNKGIPELEKERDRLNLLLKTIENDSRANKIKPKTYEELKMSVESKLGEIDYTIRKKKGEDVDEESHLFTGQEGGQSPVSREGGIVINPTQTENLVVPETEGGPEKPAKSKKAEKQALKEKLKQEKEALKAQAEAEKIRETALKEEQEREQKELEELEDVNDDDLQERGAEPKKLSLMEKIKLKLKGKEEKPKTEGEEGEEKVSAGAEPSPSEVAPAPAEPTPSPADKGEEKPKLRKKGKPLRKVRPKKGGAKKTHNGKSSKTQMTKQRLKKL